MPIALEEPGVPYRIVQVNLGARAQKQPAFPNINPNGRIPAIVDQDGPGGSALEYTFFPVGGIGPMFGQAGWFARSAPQPIDFAIKRHRSESNRLTSVLQARLQQVPWLAGTAFSVADFVNSGWLDVADYTGVNLAKHPAVRQWIDRVPQRLAVQRGMTALR